MSVVSLIHLMCKKARESYEHHTYGMKRRIQVDMQSDINIFHTISILILLALPEVLAKNVE